MTPAVSTLTPLTPQEAKALVAQGALVIDVREPDEFAREGIDGARNAPLSQLGTQPKLGGQVIFHCKSGMRTQANAAALCACVEGEGYVLAGGLEAWKAAGLPLRRSKAPLEMQRQVMIAAGGLILVGSGIGAFVHPAGFGLAAFVGTGLLLAGVSGFCGMARLLALAPWNRRAA